MQNKNKVRGLRRPLRDNFRGPRMDARPNSHITGALSNPRTLMRDRRMRDANQAPPTRSGNQIGPAQSLRAFGWIGPALSVMGNTARWAYSLNPDNDIVAANTYPLESMATTPASLLNACAIAVAGASTKTAASAAWSATPAAISLALGTASVFGAFVRISNSTQSFKYGTYEIQLTNNGAVLSYVYVQVASLPCEVVILAINNNAGKATIIGDPTPTVVFPYSTTSGAIGNLNAGAFGTGDVVYAETLNMRDIGNVVDAVDQGAILL